MEASADSDTLRQLTPKEFLGIGMNQIAYIRTIPAGDDEAVFSVHAADGTQLSIVASYNDAVAAVRTNDMFPVTLQ